MPDPARFAGALRAILPAGVSLGQADPRHLHPLAPGEALPGARPARLAEFSAGRAAARAAMGRPAALPAGADRAPEWPEGIVGSISHCAGLCLAVVAPARDWAGIGLDVEPEAPLPRDLWPTVLAPEESPGDGLEALAHFVVKEAVYKAQYRVTARLLDFDVLTVALSGGRFTASFRATVAPFDKGQTVAGHLVQAGGYLGAFAALSLPRRGDEVV
jgi:4'-phosphopantetheinyl transferase EntD